MYIMHICLFIIKDKVRIITNFNIFETTEVEKFIEQKLQYIQDIKICLNCSKNQKIIFFFKLSFFLNYLYLHIHFLI